MSDPGWRAMTPDDVSSVAALSDRVHPAFFEQPAVFADRIALFPEGSLVLADARTVAGYAIAYPISSLRPPPLDTVLGSLPADADVLYVHDVAIAPEWRGRNLAARGILQLLGIGQPLGPARRFARTELVSVYGTAPFWARFGFRVERAARLETVLAAYGADAVYMARP